MVLLLVYGASSVLVIIAMLRTHGLLLVYSASSVLLITAMLRTHGLLLFCTGTTEE